MILNCSNISKSFVGKTILDNVSFHIEEGEKAAIIGINGAGKSTLLKIIMKELAPDSGTIAITKDKSLGYLAQHQDISSERTVYDEVLSVKQDLLELELEIRSLEHEMKHMEGEALERLLDLYTRKNHEFELQNGYALRSEVTGVLKGLGFSEEEFVKPIHTLSGGQKTRVSLSKLLLSHPDILLLDEPTNHLDLPSISWLEGYLSGYQGSVIIVAHDRYFIDKVVKKIIEVENNKVRVYTGSYSDYSVKKAMIRNAMLKEYYNNQREIKHQQEVITKLKSFNREKSIKRAESREKLLAKIEVVDRPAGDAATMHFKLEPDIQSGNDVLTVKGLSKRFGTKELFSDIDFEIKRGERIALIGANGTGKTTILRILNKLLDADAGTVKLGASVETGYYDQEHAVLDKTKTLFDEISDAYPDMNNTKIRNVLAAFLFTNDEVFKRVGELSGGERGRLLLAKLMLSNANFLLLDEPTNHLDMNSKEILEDAINNYTGTCLFVSHDRYFINAVATRILDLRNNTLTSYSGNYDYYLDKSSVSNTESIAVNNSSASSSKEDWKQAKEEQAKERKRKNEIERIENRIAELDEAMADIDTELTREEVYTDVKKLTELDEKKELLLKEQEDLYELWDELS